MSGSGQVWVQPSTLVIGAQNAGQWARGIPVPGAGGSIPAVGGIATCANLIADSPPTLLEEFQIYSYSVAWAFFLNGAGAAPNVDVEIALLVNDRVRYQNDTTASPVVAAGGGNYLGNGTWSSDLNNPIRVGARDRLSLQVGLLADQAYTSAHMYAAAQNDYTGSADLIIAQESTISFNVLDLPASRRL